MIPNHEAFRYCYAMCLTVDSNVYDYLPDGQARYPFIYVGENHKPLGEIVKDESVGEVRQNIHLFGTVKQRSKLNQLATHIHNQLKLNSGLGTYHFRPKEITFETINDNSTSQPLIHIVISVLFNYSK